MISFVCPRCKSDLEKISDNELRCSQDGLTFYKVDGIWRFLLPERVEYYARFVRDYETVRRFEGRGSADESYYRTFPYHASSDWKIRATSFNAFVKQIIIPIENNNSPYAKRPEGSRNSGL
ncbi:MAG: hypothetical protein Q7J80_13105, partial [Anaerolineales bacterium]|nr:hypothetical protein [Anaerolineales bacterium]